MGVRAEAVTLEKLGEIPGRAPEELRAEIARLDREASLLRNRSQITPKTRARISTLRVNSAKLSATLPVPAAASESQAARKTATHHRFAHGHSLYLEHQAPVINAAQSALLSLTQIALSPALERDIVALHSKLDRHNSDMSHFTPSQGVPMAMTRLLFVHT